MRLVLVQDGMMLDAVAAEAWFALVEAARAEYGRTLTITVPGGAYRSPEMVLDMWQYPRKYKATGGVAKPRSLGGPGSVHENGRCVDIWNWSSLAGDQTTADVRLQRLAARFGFRRTISGEPWHYQHDGRTGGGGGGSGVTPEPIDIQEEGPNMIVLLKASTAADAASGGGLFCLYAPDAAEPAARWQEFSEYPIARALVDALHSRRKDAAEASAVVLPDYAWSVWKQRAIGSGQPVAPPAGAPSLVGLATKDDVDAAASRVVTEVTSQVPPAVIDEMKKPGN